MVPVSTVPTIRCSAKAKYCTRERWVRENQCVQRGHQERHARSVSQRWALGNLLGRSEPAILQLQRSKPPSYTWNQIGVLAEALWAAAVSRLTSPRSGPAAPDSRAPVGGLPPARPRLRLQHHEQRRGAPQEPACAHAEQSKLTSPPREGGRVLCRVRSGWGPP